LSGKADEQQDSFYSWSFGTLRSRSAGDASQPRWQTPRVAMGTATGSRLATLPNRSIIGKPPTMPDALNDPSIFRAALEGLERRREQLEEHIRSVRSMLRGISGAGSRPRGSTADTASAGEAVPAPQKRRRMSAAGRRAIAEAQRKRWAAKRGGATATASRKATKKRNFSAAARKRLAEAMRQRWAVKRTAAQAAARKKSAKKATKKRAVKSQGRKASAKRAIPVIAPPTSP
jgi:hypothetical protein